VYRTTMGMLCIEDMMDEEEGIITECFNGGSEDNAMLWTVG
jgi:hypothetical protein